MLEEIKHASMMGPILLVIMHNIAHQPVVSDAQLMSFFHSFLVATNHMLFKSYIQITSDCCTLLFCLSSACA